MSVGRLEARFAACAAEGRAAFVAYLMAGDPDGERSLELLRGLPGGGADVIELGFPFSDPMAEGPTIQRASLRSLEAGTTLASTLELVRAFRGLNAGLTFLSREVGDVAPEGLEGALGIPRTPSVGFVEISHSPWE